MHLRRLALLMTTLAVAAACVAAGSPAAVAYAVYGPGSSSWAAYYANPQDTATWAPFCAGAGGTVTKSVPGIPVPACGPTGSTDIDVPTSYPYTTTGEIPTDGFQCVELVQRYLYVAEHWGALAGDGADMARIYGSQHSITPVPNGTTGQAPQVGDVISFSVVSGFTDNGGLDPGHAAIVSASDVNATTGDGSITILSQNWTVTTAKGKVVHTAAFTPLTVSDWSVQAITTDNENGVPVNTPYVQWLPPPPPLPPTVTGVPLPSGGTGPYLSSEACASTASCVAAGYTTDGGVLEPMLVTGSGTAWQAIAVPLPGSGSLGGELDSVACPSASACVAVGEDDVSGEDQGLLVTGSGKSWQEAYAPLPGNSQTPPDAQLSAVACRSATFCVAVGSYVDSSDNTQGLLLTGSGQNWTPFEAPLPADLPDVAVSLTSVTCPSASACVAAGQYTEPGSGVIQGLLLTGSGKAWTPAGFSLPANAAAGPAVQLYAVACSSASACVATGSYEDSSGNTQGLLVTGSVTSWKATEAPLPADAAANPEATLASVACPSATACVAASWYVDSSGNYHGLLLTGSGTKWTPFEAPLPAGAATTPNAQLNAVACHAKTSCGAVGDYRDSSGNYQGLLLTGSGTSWTPTEAPLPASAAPPADLQRIACPSTTWCAAAGGYEDGVLMVTGL